jgi:hypothetical protein
MIMNQMEKHVQVAGSDAPVIIRLAERADVFAFSHYSHYRMDSLLTPYGNPDARLLD